MRIAVDGTASAGKGALARGVAIGLGLSYVDTGAMYRTIGLYGVQGGVVVKDELRQPIDEAVSYLLAKTENVEFDFIYDATADNPWRVIVDDDDITETIRRQEIGVAASVVSSIPEIRRALFESQQRMANRKSVIMDGRDIGTVIMPNAELKVFVDADIDVRARRRWSELQGKGTAISYKEVRAGLADRDHRDRTREIAPLVRAKDARLLDTSALSIEDGVSIVIDWVKQLSPEV